MKWPVTFPEENVMIVRPSLIAICMGGKSAAYLLSALLYRYSIRKEGRDDAENLNEVKNGQGEEGGQDTTYHIYRKQSQLVADMCDVIVEKTLHDVAVPILQILGYLDIEEYIQCNRYTLHIDAIEAALSTYKNQRDQLEKFLIGNLQLEKFLMTSDEAQNTRSQLEKFLINKKKFQLPLEKVLIANRKSSNCKRGRKASPGASSEGKNQRTKISNRDIEITSNESNITDAANADIDTHTSQEISDEQGQAWAEAHGYTKGVSPASAKGVPAPLQPGAPAPGAQEHTDAGQQAVMQNSTPPQEKPRRTRKPKPQKPAIDESTQRRIDHVYAFLSKLGQEATKIPDFTYSPSEVSTDAIIAWLATNPTEEILREVYFELWNEKPNAKTGFHWQKNMTIKAVLGQYTTRSMAIRSRLSQVKRTTEASPEQPKQLGWTEDRACELATQAVEQARTKGHEIETTVQPLDNGLWYFVVQWKTRNFEEPENIRTEKKWNSRFLDMCELWKSHDVQRRVKVHG